MSLRNAVVTLSGGQEYLEWEARSAGPAGFEIGQRGVAIQRPEELLDDFLRLAWQREADPQEALSLARRWGRLGICEAHGLPLGHALGPLSRRVPKDLVDANPFACTKPGRESVVAWHGWASATAAILKLAGRIAAEGPRLPPEDLWRTAWWPMEIMAEMIRPGRRRPSAGQWVIQRRVLGTLLTQRLEEAQAGLSASIDRASGDLRLSWKHTGTFLAELNVQLAMRATNTRGFVKCRGCPNYFNPSHGNQKFCEECGRQKVANRRNQQSWRARRKK